MVLRFGYTSLVRRPGADRDTGPSSVLVVRAARGWNLRRA